MAIKSSTIALFFIFNLVISEPNTGYSTAPSQAPTTPPRPLVVSRRGDAGACPKDALKLGVCANLLTKLLNLSIGSPPKEPCCPLIQGLLDLEAAVCLCTAIKANVLGIKLNIPVSLSLLVNYCGSKVPKGFQCR